MTDHAQHDERVAQFVAVTGASDTQARFFLDAANWQLDAAVTAFFDNPTGGSSAAGTSSSSSAAAAPGIQPASEVVSRTARVATLGSMASSANKDDQGNTYFAGGERSGVAIQGPGDKKPETSSDLVRDILQLAQNRGPRPPRDDDDDDDDDAMDEDSDSEDEGAARKPTYFSGAGHRLGSEETPSEVVMPLTAAQDHPTMPKKLGKVKRTLTFWRNGFSIEDGPLHPYDDPHSKLILEALKSGRAPLHVLNVQPGQPVDLQVAHKSDEDFKPPPAKPFSGQGNRLGSVIPGDFASSSSSSALPPTTATAASSSRSAPPPTATGPLTAEFEVDPTQPTTSVQVRLADGTRLVGKFNHAHTVGDLRQFVRRARPQQRAFSLNTTFPMKELTEDTATLAEAGLLNAVVVQKYV
ncbi:hypothetical protein AMAG_14585 [Allomyces macrogynus ATCC 38327]|uniref:SEP domain-containing protein n=1 Tax=Allomyces macrogynus (strain ATCC 38327) TaxID=578462 RepID=A0A0L0T6V8_ALLM3|nr:hypothetical protein AMAG_14585 [Allomyces macrogynus ATCC 38327]|eukprot:KNE70457.1 hypothetical protein AMAG_14585 [Allomyces macrogynus ATCC 38327]